MHRSPAARRRPGGPGPRSEGAVGRGFGLDQYVTDRPYAASSFLSVAIARVFGSALAGRSRGRQDWADAPLPLVARVSALPCRGGERFLRSLFEPLGYSVAATRHPLDERFPAWGDSPYFDIELTGRLRLSELLAHLYVLMPVLDDDKHYWVGVDEVEKLLRHGEGWLATHPEREAIALRYLKHRRRLMRDALARLVEEDQGDPDAETEVRGQEEERLETRLSLNEQRLAAVVAELEGAQARRVLDLGCGEGKLLRALLAVKQFDELVGVDVSARTLERAAERLRLEQMPPRQRQRVRLLQGALTYRDRRLEGFDAAAVVEVIEHLDPPRLDSFARALFGYARPQTVVMTTPNSEYNVRFESLPAGAMRHRDHRFEWTRAEYEAWARGVASRFGYAVRFSPVGASDPEVGPPTQMAVFVREAEARPAAGASA